jgi:spermidine synthase
VVHKEVSPGGVVYVVDEGDLRHLRFNDINNASQSKISLSDPKKVPMEYIRLSTIGLAYIEIPQQVLMIGLGGGTLTTFLWQVLPDVQIDAVEIDPVVYRIARKYFRLPDDPRYRVHIDDGLRFLEAADKLYDWIYVDAYTGDGIPSHLITRDFFLLTRSRLKESGITALNLAVKYDLRKTIVEAFASVFPDTVCYQTFIGNLVVIGINGPLPDPVDVLKRATHLTTQLNLPFDLRDEAKLLTDCGLEK